LKTEHLFFVYLICQICIAKTHYLSFTSLAMSEKEKKLIVGLLGGPPPIGLAGVVREHEGRAKTAVLISDAQHQLVEKMTIITEELKKLPSESSTTTMVTSGDSLDAALQCVGADVNDVVLVVVSPHAPSYQKSLVEVRDRLIANDNMQELFKNQTFPFILGTMSPAYVSVALPREKNVTITMRKERHAGQEGSST
jgi:hypothetical protein